MKLNSASRIRKHSFGSTGKFQDDLFILLAFSIDHIPIVDRNRDAGNNNNNGARARARDTAQWKDGTGKKKERRNPRDFPILCLFFASPSCIFFLFLSLETIDYTERALFPCNGNS